jgi:hypothetical protein
MLLLLLVCVTVSLAAGPKSNAIFTLMTPDAAEKLGKRKEKKKTSPFLNASSLLRKPSVP